MPFVAAAMPELVICRAEGASTIDALTEVLCAGLPLSVTVAVKLEVPLAAGVPAMVPFEPIAKPAGKLPAVTIHEYAGVPPLAFSACEYAMPLVPPAREGAMATSVDGETTMESATDLLCAGLLASITVTLKLEVPVAVEVPEMIP